MKKVLQIEFDKKTEDFAIMYDFEDMNETTRTHLVGLIEEYKQRLIMINLRKKDQS